MMLRQNKILEINFSQAVVGAGGLLDNQKRPAGVRGHSQGPGNCQPQLELRVATSPTSYNDLNITLEHCLIFFTT